MSQYIWFPIAKRKMTQTPWHHLLWNKFGNIVQCQQKKHWQVARKTWSEVIIYLPLKFHSFRIAVLATYVYTVINISLCLVNLSLNVFLHFGWNLTLQVLYLYVLPNHLLNSRWQPWKCIYVGAELEFVARIFL